MRETKRRVQARIYEQTKDLTPEQLVAHYERFGEAARQRDAGACPQGGVAP